MLAGFEAQGSGADMPGTGTGKGGLERGKVSGLGHSGEGEEGHIHGSDGMTLLPGAKIQGIAVRPEDRFLAGLPVGKLDGIFGEVIDGGVPEAEGALVFGDYEKSLFLSHRTGVVVSDREGEGAVEVPLEAVAGGLVEAGGKLDLGGGVTDTETDGFDKENPALEENAGRFEVGFMKSAEEIDPGRGVEANRFPPDGIAFHGGSLDGHLVMGPGGPEKEVKGLVIGIEAPDLGGERSPVGVEGEIEEVHVGMVPLKVPKIEQHAGVSGIKTVAQDAETAFGKEDAAVAGIAGERFEGWFHMAEGPEIFRIVEKAVCEVKDVIPAYEFAIPETGKLGPRRDRLEKPLVNWGQVISPVEAAGHPEIGIAVHEMERLRKIGQDGAPVRETAFAVAPVGVEIAFDMVLEDFCRGFPEDCAFAEFGEKDAKLEQEPGGEDGPVPEAVAFLPVFKDKPSGGAEKGFQEAAKSGAINLADDPEEAGAEQEIDEADTAGGKAEFIKDDIVAGPGPGNGFALLVPLIEQAGPGLKVGGILLFDGGVKETIHPGEIVEAVFGRDAPGSVEVDGAGEVVDFCIELVGFPLEDQVRESGIPGDAGKDRGGFIKKGMDGLRAFLEMGPETSHGLLKVTFRGRAFPWIRGTHGVFQVMEKGGVGNMNNTFRKAQVVIGHGKKMNGAFTGVRLTLWLGRRRGEINRESSIW